MNKTISILNEAAREIRSLRHRNEILAAKAEVLDTFRLALAHRQDGVPMCPDVVWHIERHVEALQQPDSVPPQPQE